MEEPKVTSDFMVTYSNKRLSPCPFCGEVPQLKKFGGWLIDHSQTKCPIAMRSSEKFPYQKYAIEYWETRVPAPQKGELKPCPFCGKSVKLVGTDYIRIEGSSRNDDVYFCPIHDTRTYYAYKSKSEAIKYWNTRY